jgi:ribosomal protein S18 acetylase RimI-like enzyme
MPPRAARGSKSSGGVATVSLLNHDAQILRDAVLKSVRTSPESFLATVDDVEARLPDYWESELQSATWAVMERDGRVVGIAAAKRPGDQDTVYASPREACFIESVWIDPSIRRLGLGERLVNYLIEMQRQKGVQEFYLWVFENNMPAIGLYEHMNFKETDRIAKLRGRPMREVQYLLKFDSDAVDLSEQQQSEEARNQDQLSSRITYRLLK